MPIRVKIPKSSVSANSERQNIQAIPTDQKTAKSTSCSIDHFDSYQTISAWIAGVGLLILGLSPFFKWINFGAGGVTGLAGNGKILLAVTTLAAASYVAAIVKRKWLTPVLLSVQAWATITMFWMGTLIWNVGSVLDSPDVKDNPFAAMFSFMLVSPGTGLYLGLIGGITVSVALGFVAVHHFLLVGNLKPFYASQAVSCILGILLVVFVGSDQSPKSGDTRPGSLFSSQIKKEKIFDAQLGETFVIGNLEITPKKIQLVTLNERPVLGEPKPRKSKSYVLTFVARNKSDGQVFSAYSSSSVTDNFGNKCSDPTNSLSMSLVQIDGNEDLRNIRPGESANVIVAFDPALESAKEYTWIIRTQISNQDEYEKWRIHFSPTDIPAPSSLNNSAHMLWTDEQVLRAIQTPPPAAAVPDGATYEARLQEARALYTRGKMKSDAWFEAYRAYRQAMRYNDLKFSDPGDSYDYQVILDEVARQVLADYQEAAQAFNRRSYKPAGALLRKINRYAGGATPLFGKEFRDHIDKLESYSAIDLKKYGDRVDPGAPVLLTRIRVLELMNKAEAAWQTGDATLALSTFEKMQEGGTDERPEGTTSRTFADAGAAKCKVRLAINQKRYGDAAADLEGFKKLAATLDADKKFPPEGLHLAQRLQSEVAHELHTELELRKRMADAPVLENERR